MKSTIFTMTLTMALLSTTSFAADKKKMAEMSPEQRQSMAVTHEKMAACLRSDKSAEDCHKEMMQSCQEVMGKDGCQMMGKKGKMGKMHDKAKGMMKNKDDMKDEMKE